MLRNNNLLKHHRSSIIDSNFAKQMWRPETTYKTGHHRKAKRVGD